jgi:hypothetical protein
MIIEMQFKKMDLSWLLASLATAYCKNILNKYLFIVLKILLMNLKFF